MKHIDTITIETERLILRKFCIEDASLAYKNWCHDTEVVKYLTWPIHASCDVTKEVITNWVQLYTDHFYHWAIVLKETNEPIGSIGVVEENEKENSVDIGYCIGSKWWHHGYTTEAFQAIIPFLFDEVDVSRIESYHEPDNPNSGKVMEKCGLKFEKVLKNYHTSNNGLVDACFYSITKEG